jgi:hypothetical protein
MFLRTFSGAHQSRGGASLPSWGVKLKKKVLRGSKLEKITKFGVNFNFLGRTLGLGGALVAPPLHQRVQWSICPPRGPGTLEVESAEIIAMVVGVIIIT